MCPTIEFTAHDLVYNDRAVCQASIEDLKYSKKKNRKAWKEQKSRKRGGQMEKKLHESISLVILPGEKFSHIFKNAFRLDSGVELGASDAFR